MCIQPSLRLGYSSDFCCCILGYLSVVFKLIKLGENRLISVFFYGSGVFFTSIFSEQFVDFAFLDQIVLEFDIIKSQQFAK